MRKNLKRIACLLATVMCAFSISACSTPGALESILESMGAWSSSSSDFSSESLLDTASSSSSKKDSSSSKNESASENHNSELTSDSSVSSSLHSSSSIHSSSESSSFDSSEDSSWDSSEDSSENSSSSVEDIEANEFSIHFLELGNQYTGDSTLIKVGDVEVLIDAGSRKNSASTITKYVNQYCTDGVLEYVIATHAHEDHIAGFVGTSSAKGVFESFVCETIIDYSLTNSTTQIREAYEKARDAEVALGATHHTVLECWNNENGAQRSYELGNGVTMNFLYQEFYEKNTSDENDYSVCMLLSQGQNHYLFTGDLEEKGEASLVKNNDLPKCQLYKAGHHGSKTSSTQALLSVIQPEIVCVCCCCGSTEYTTVNANTFPTQAFVNRVAPYTDRVYVTTMVTTNGFTSMNGNIVVITKYSEVSVNCSNNNTLFKDTDWFKKNRTMPAAWKS